MHNIKWDDLQFVLAVAEAGSFSSAARALNVHHATVLRRIAAFEDRCGVKIFERGPRGYHLTPESSHILSTVRNINAQVDKLGRTIAIQNNAITGPLKITTTDALCSAVVLKHCGEFCDLYPAIQLELLARNDHLNLSMLESDITIRPARSLPAELHGEYVCDLGFAAYATPNYLQGSELKGDIAQHQWLGVTGAISRVPFASWLDSQVPAHNVVFRADSFVTLRAAAEADRGITFLPCCLGDRSSSLIPVETATPRFSNGLWVAAHQDLIGAPKIQAAITFFLIALQGDKPLLEGRSTDFGSTESR